MSGNFRLKLATTAFLLFSQGALGAYNLVKDYSGPTFFDNWEYYGGADNLTNGHVNWVNQSVASGTPNLAYLNDAGNAIIRVDNVSRVDLQEWREKRNSIRLTSLDKLKLGTFVTFDVLHLPWGCSTWGALWTKAVGDAWPDGGEIDIFEGVNLQTRNQMALHAHPGCKQAEGAAQSGTSAANRNCDNESTTGAGCTVIDANANSYGEPFAAAGGGVWAMEFAETGINIWFFSRADVPQSLSGDSVDIASLGTPSGAWPASSCDPAEYFKDQEIVIDITLCGDWAGLPNILAATSCPLTGTNDCWQQYVIDPANYDDAYFEIKAVKIFAAEASAVVSSAGANTGSTPTRTGTGRTSSTPSPTSTGNSAQRVSSLKSLAVASAAIGVVGLALAMV